MTTAMQDVLVALSAAMKNRPVPILDEDARQEAEVQAVYSLVCSDAQAMQYIAKNVKLMWEQQQLSETLEDIPYVVLKGSCASIYYPQPIRRTVGDIDLLVDPAHFETAQEALEESGYISVHYDDRHIHYERNSTTIELHRRFAILNTKDQEELLDGWLFSTNITIGKVGKYLFPMPQDDLNGLVLLTHINQHLEGGLGLRHILDWVMYVNSSLPDRKWLSFKEKTDILGLTTLAKVAARFGQVYLELNEDIIWCLDADDRTVDKLLDYISKCGNFGYKDLDNNTIIKVLSHGRGVKGFFRNLQDRGLSNWKATQKYVWLTPFAWVYQLLRYIRKGINQGGLKNMGVNIEESHKRNTLLDELDATRRSLKEPLKKEKISAKGIASIDSLKYKLIRPLYYWIKKTVLCKPLYYVNDGYYIFSHGLLGKEKISESDRKNVENNVTFIFKSFNRQRQAKRLYRNLKKYYPSARVIIADDSREPLMIEGAEIVYLPFNSGLSKGLISALESVDTEFVMRMDDDELLTPASNVHGQLAYLQTHPNVDLIGLQATHRFPEQVAMKYSRIRMNKQLLIPVGTMIDGKEVVYKTPNVFIARTDKIRQIGYDPNIRMNDHHEFFYRAAGEIVSVQDLHSYVMHCHNRFENEYDLYRSDTNSDYQYILEKHGKSYWQS